MAVKDFLEPKNVKLTTEKIIPRKPTVAELTIIEQPGKPMPADHLEPEPLEKKPVKKKVTKKKKEPSKETNRLLIITEKPQAAEKIANALGDARKYTEDGASYFQLTRDTKTITVASAVGHLFNLEYVKGQKGWPVYNVEWKPSFEGKGAFFTKKYLTLLKQLALQASSFMVATDYDTEGEVIGWNILRFLCNQTDAHRMHYSTLTKEELEQAYQNPEPTLNWKNAYAGEARHIIDWLYGINLSRALMSALKKTGSFQLLSTGRVQGPALKILVDREKEITSFVSQPYWQVYAQVGEVTLKHPTDIFEKEKLEAFKKVKEGVASTTKKQESQKPGVPFDLTTLQREASRIYKFSPSQTLQLAQKLYLAGAISYPRTSSQKIPPAIKPKEIIKKLGKRFPEAQLAIRIHPIEGPKTDPAHPSIYPTGEFKSLTEQEEKLYTLIVKRFLACFAPDLELATTHIDLKTTAGVFTANAQQVLNPGWTAFYPYEVTQSTLPDMQGTQKIDKITTEQKETQPPGRYSATSLVTILEKKNLGTKSTRSMIIDILFDRGYVDGKSVTPTPLGMKLIEALETNVPIIIDEQLTRQIEEKMGQIETSDTPEVQEKESIAQAKQAIETIAVEFKKNEEAIGKILAEGLTTLRKKQQEDNTLSLCPTCKTGNLRILYNRAAKRSFIACSAYPTCKQTYSLPPNALIKPSGKTCEADGFPKLLAIRKAKRPWEFCFNPSCPIEQAKKDKWAAKKTQE
ncbi:DNA topoisomerase I [Candidatus Pacearchaeota archaeon]|nr:DNA topoisomerase I [Candidatus Pacearchaeota archaeon]